MTFEREYKGNKYDYGTDLSNEISVFGDDGVIDREENKILGKILSHNQLLDREEELIRDTTKESLSSLIKIEGVSGAVKRRIEIILEGGDEENNLWGDEKNDILSNDYKKYLTENGELRNVSDLTLLELMKMRIDYIDLIVIDSTRFSIVDKNGIRRNVYYSSTKKDYFYLDTCGKCEKVRIYDGDKLDYYHEYIDEE